jgi:hypothetical protein
VGKGNNYKNGVEMADNLSPTIEKKAVNKVEELFLTRESFIDPHFSRDDKFPLLDGCIIVYKTANKSNDNISDTIDVQIKGKTQEEIEFDETVKFSIERGFLRLIHTKLGGLFFVVKMDSNTFNTTHIYYNLFDFNSTSKLFEEIKDQATITVILKKYSSLSDFTKECQNLIDNRKLLVQQLEALDPKMLEKQVPKQKEQKDAPVWYKTIYIRGDK